VPPELSIARVFQHELDTLPLPPESMWLPRIRSTERPTLFGAAVGVVALTSVIVITSVGLRTSPEATRVGSGGATPSPRASSCLDTLSERPCVHPLPNLYRNPTIGYNLAVSGQFRKVVDVIATPPVSGLLYRERYTVRPVDEDQAAVAQYGSLPPWDFVVEIYEGRATTPGNRARLDGCGEECVTTQTTIRQEPTLAATWNAGVLQIHAYYIDRGNQVLVLKYATGPEQARPPSVNESDLQRIVETIGLV
jgi:hypothetical protein